MLWQTTIHPICRANQQKPRALQKPNDALSLLLLQLSLLCTWFYAVRSIRRKARCTLTNRPRNRGDAASIVSILRKSIHRFRIFSDSTNAFDYSIFFATFLTSIAESFLKGERYSMSINKFFLKIIYIYMCVYVYTYYL